MRSRRAPALLALVASATLAASCGAGDDASPVRIGVVLPAESFDAIAWAAANVNRAGGVAGRRLEVFAADPASAKALAADPSVTAVIGPETSRALFDVAPAFLAANKPLVSPSATAGGIFRAFGGSGVVWRTVEPDIAQVESMLLVARQGGARKVAMLTSEDAYGETFRDWFGFFARELGLEVTALETYREPSLPSSCAPYVEASLAGAPDALLAVPSDPATATCFQRTLAGRQVRVLYSDIADAPAIASTLGPAAEGMEGITGAPRPGTGFEAAYVARTGKAPPSYAAQAYDAVLLLAYGLERSGGQGGARLGQAMAEIVDGRGSPVGWDEQGVAAALRAIGEGGLLPDVSGAATDLSFDPDYHTDPTSSTYARWRVEGGRARVVETLPTSVDVRAAYRTYGSELARQDPSYAGGPTTPRTGLRALLAATSRGVENHRHQADVLAMYRAVRAAGLADDRILLAVADDLGPDVPNEPGGPNLRDGAVIDRDVGSMSADDLLAALRTLGSAPGDDVLVFLSGHGTTRGLDFDGKDFGVVTPARLADTVLAMRAEGAFRRMLIAVDACQSGALAREIVARAIPGVGVLTSSSAYEGSLATNFDPARGRWLADEFSFELASLARRAPDRSLLEVYRDLYLRVPGSHVTLHNAPAFLDVAAEPFRAFLGP